MGPAATDDPHGDHHAARATSVVLFTFLEHAVANSACVPNGRARVARHVRLADMNLDVPIADERRIEVVANGFPFGMDPSSHSMPLLFPPHTSRRGTPVADVQPGWVVTNARTTNGAAWRSTYPELGHARRCRRNSGRRPALAQLINSNFC